MDYSLPGSSVHGVLQGKNTGVGCHDFLQGIFLTQGSNSWRLLCLLHCSQVFFTTEPPKKPPKITLSPTHIKLTLLTFGIFPFLCTVDSYQWWSFIQQIFTISIQLPSIDLGCDSILCKQFWMLLHLLGIIQKLLFHVISVFTMNIYVST